MLNAKFVHLHLHTTYSPLDGAIKIKPLVSRLNELGMDACAITDHGSMFGTIDFYKACKEGGVRPIIGCEVYIAPGDRRIKERGEDGDVYYHLVLLAENNVGLANLYKLSSLGYIDGLYYKPRIDKEILEKYSEGIIALSACLAGEVPRTFFKHGYEAAKAVALEYERIMGKGNYFLEIQENGIEEQTIINNQLLNISKETGIELVATCDSHYLLAKDHKSHSILMDIQYSQGTTRQSSKNNGENGSSAEIDGLVGSKSQQKTIVKRKGHEYSDQLYVKSADEMLQAFHYAPEAVHNTVKIAERCNTSINFDELRLPKYDVPEGYTIESYFTELSRNMLDDRLKRVDKSEHETYKNRLEFEIDIIVNKGFDGYFLIVWDFIKYAREQGIPVGPGRGSGAGSLVAYSLGITDIDPIQFNLLFERFLNPERPSMPDFDIDFCTDKRGEVIEYVVKKYGADRVAQIATFGTLKPKNAVRDVCRVYDISMPVVNKLAKAIPDGPMISSFDIAFRENPTLKEEFESIPFGEEILQHSLNVEGLIRNVGMHAAGVIIADAPIVDYAPLFRTAKDETRIVQFAKKPAESIGLIKFDFLGLTNLTIIADAVARVRKIEGQENFDIDHIPLDDEEVFEMLQRGDTLGIFQLESSGMRSLLKKMQPTVFEDIIAANALFRPGPLDGGVVDDFIERKHGRQQVVYDIPAMENVLKETYGVIVYQEQVMELARVLAGYSLGTADILRRAIGDKNASVMAKHKQIFVDGDEELNIKGAKALGYDASKVLKTYDMIEKFGAYGFNKSHSAAYAYVAYQTAYLKCHFPLQYSCALASADYAKPEERVKYINDALSTGTTILPPDVNKSYVDFTVDSVDGKEVIRFGLCAVKNIGEAALENIITERDANGDFKGIYDFCERMGDKSANKKMLEALISVGAFDCFGKTRSQLKAVYMEALDAGVHQSKMREKGMFSIADFTDEETEEYYPDNIVEMPQKEILSLEKEYLGFYFSSHPLKEYNNAIDVAVTTSISDMMQYKGEKKVNIAGMIKKVEYRITKTKQERMAIVIVEDLSSEVEVVVFPRQFANYAHLLVEDSIVFITGEVKEKFMDAESVSMNADEIYDLGDGLEKFTGGIVISVDKELLTTENVFQIKASLAKHGGALPVKVAVVDKGSSRVVVRLGDEYNINPSADFYARIQQLVGFISVEVLPASERCFKDVYKGNIDEEDDEEMATNFEKLSDVV